MAETENKSACHGVSVSEREGKPMCDVCGSECEAVAGSGSAQAPAAPALNPGDVCTLPDGSEGIVAPDGVCVPRAPADQMPKEGDACEIDGKAGTFRQGENGGLVCVPHSAEQQ